MKSINVQDECTFRPKISSKIPDFKKAQRTFEKVLENSRSQKSTTIPIPFAMLSRLRKSKSLNSEKKDMEVKTHIRREKIVVNHNQPMVYMQLRHYSLL